MSFLRGNRAWAVAASASAVLLVACAPEDAYDAELGTFEAPLAIEGRWRIPSDIMDLGDAQTVPYTGAGPWTGPGACSGGMEPGTQHLREYLRAYFPQTYSIGGYSCRSIVGDSSSMSVHGTGRALDIMLPLASGSQADNDLGDPIAHWLIAHAADLGIQMIIWDRSSWRADRDAGDKEKAYNGQHPHHDHLHVELSVPAGNEELPWYGQPWVAPEIPNCDALADAGGEIDDKSACFLLFGPAATWRLVEGKGQGGSYRWTNAFENDDPSNWARWSLDVARAGRYDVDVHIPAGEGVFPETRYGVRHGDAEAEVTINQTTAAGWTRLGTFAFAVGANQHVEVYDNAYASVGDAKKIVVDSLRLSPEGTYGDGGDDGDRMGGGCSVGAPRGRGAAHGAWLLGAFVTLAGTLGARRRRP